MDKSELDTSGLRPIFVTMIDLRRVLGRFMQGIPWAEDALQDLWRMSAPAPYSMDCPSGRCRRQEMGHAPCEKHTCYFHRRMLLPTQFAKWWQDVSERQGLELKAGTALGELMNDPHRRNTFG